MASNSEATSVSTAISVFLAKTVRLFSWLGMVLGLVASGIFFVRALQVNPAYKPYTTEPPFLGMSPEYFTVAIFWLSIAFSGAILSVVVQAAIVFFEHARNQYLAADAMERLTSRLRK
jgi:hypothetical protein